MVTQGPSWSCLTGDATTGGIYEHGNISHHVTLRKQHELSIKSVWETTHVKLRSQLFRFPLVTISWEIAWLKDHTFSRFPRRDCKRQHCVFTAKWRVSCLIIKGNKSQTVMSYVNSLGYGLIRISSLAEHGNSSYYIKSINQLGLKVNFL